MHACTVRMDVYKHAIASVPVGPGAPYLCGHLTVFLCEIIGQLAKSVVLIGQ